MSARPPAPGSLGAAARCEQYDRQDHLFGRHAAVQERAAIPRLVFAQLRGVDEEPISRGEQQAHAEPHAREPERLQVFHGDRGLRVLAAQILAELVAQVRGGVALGVHRRGRAAVNRAMIGGEQHRDAAPLRLEQRRAHRRALEPGAGETPQRRLVARHLVQDRALGAPVRELVDEVEHERRHPVLGQVRREPAQQLAAVHRAEQLLVAHGHRRPDQLPQLLGQQLRFVRVEALVVRGLAPPVGVSRGDLHREQPGEDRVAREGRRGRQDAVVVGLLDVEQRRHQVAQRLPLIEPQAVDDDEQHPPVGAEFLVPVLKAQGRVLFIVIDCLRLDQWEALRDLVTPLFDVEESHYYSILPTATPFARNAIFSGLFPMEIAARHADWWGQASDEESLNAHEAELLTEQLRELVGTPVPVRYEKLFSSVDGGELLRRLPAHLSQDGVTALVFNFIDQLTHGRSESAILYEVARDEAALRSLTRTWFERSPVLAALQEAERRGVTVLLTTDHGSIHCETPATVYAKRDATANLRYKFGEDLRSEDPEAAIAVEDLKGFGLPGMGLGVRLLLAAGDRFFVYPTKLREYQARYRGSFLHGGVTPEEVILPVALLTPRGRAKGSGGGGAR